VRVLSSVLAADDAVDRKTEHRVIRLANQAVFAGLLARSTTKLLNSASAGMDQAL
jgi:hypothetical protein